MKAQANFLIKKREDFNSMGKIIHEYYYILEFKKYWFGISRWKKVCHEECNENGCYGIETKFHTLEDAQNFVREVLCPEIPRNASVERTVDEMVCKKGESKW